MAEEIPFERPYRTGQEEDVLGKIDQLLNRHRPKPPDALAQTAPVPTDARQVEPSPAGDDAIPTLTDVVAGPGQPARRVAGLSPATSPGSALMIQRMSIALDVEHLRLLAQIDRDDAAQARMLDRLVAELKRALPGAVQAALSGSSSPPRSEGDAPL
jgi:hypothetical protein